MRTTQTHDRIPRAHLAGGGAVRDKLLKRLVVDQDHVMVGALPEELLAPAAKWWRLLSLFFVCPRNR